MKLQLKERQTLIKIFQRKYRYATKSEKGRILDEFVSFTGFNRKYSSRVLNQLLNSVTKKRKKGSGRPVVYDETVCKALKEVWEILDYVCGKRLVAALPEMLKKLKYFNEIEIEKKTEDNLLKISASTADRLLKNARNKMGRKGTSMTKSGKYLIDRIPIKTFGEWSDTEPGFTQMDLVAHNGGNVFGGFYSTLNTTDICTGWTICNLVRDKTEFQMIKALLLMRKCFPFPLKGIHSDNGGEFINKTVLKFADKYKLEFTRGRPYKKNDNPHVEQKNYSILRRNTGYLRYDQPEHAAVLRKLYGYINLYVNYFQPIMILVEKHRIGAKAMRKYDIPKTPYQRLLERKDIPVSVKNQLRKIYKDLNPAELKRIINDCQRKLIKMAAPVRAPIKKVRVRRPKEIKHTKPQSRRDFNPQSPNPFLERQKMEEMKRAAEIIWKKRKQ